MLHILILDKMQLFVFGFFVIFASFGPALVTGKCSDGPIADVKILKEMGEDKFWMVLKSTEDSKCENYYVSEMHNNPYMLNETYKNTKTGEMTVWFSATNDQGMTYSKNQQDSSKQYYSVGRLISFEPYQVGNNQELIWSTAPLTVPRSLPFDVFKSELEKWRWAPMGGSGTSKCICWYWCSEDGEKARAIECVAPSSKAGSACDKPIASINKAMKSEKELKNVYDEKECNQK